MKKLMTLAILAAGVVTGWSDSFDEKEQSFSVFGSYIDKQDGGIGIGGSYDFFWNRNLGFSLTSYIENFGGTFIDNLAGEVKYRWPMEEYKLAPYALGMLGWSWETDEAFCAFGGGAEYMVKSNMRLFGDIRYQFNDDTRDGIGLRAGVKFLF